MTLRIALVVLPLVVACQSAPGPEVEAPAETTKAVETPAASPADLVDLITEFAALTGRNITFDEHTGALLAAIPVSPIGSAEHNILLIGPAPARQAEAAPPEFQIIKLEFAAAPELAATLTELLDASTRAIQKEAGKSLSASTDAGASVLADERTNSLLVTAPTDRMAELKTLITLLDVSSEATAE